MVDIRKRLTAQWKDAVNFVLGLWLIVSPWALNFVTDQTATWNAWAVGVVITVAALAALIAFNKWEEWVEIALGFWLIVSPYLLGFATQLMPTWNQAIVGVIVAALAFWAVMATPEATGRAMR